MERIHVFDLHCDTLDVLAWPVLPPELAPEGTFHHPAAPVDSPAAEGAGTSPLPFASARGHLSLTRMQAFSWCQCLAVFVPDQLAPEQGAEFFRRVSATLATHVERSPELLGVARDAGEIAGILDSSRTCALLTVENAGFLGAGGSARGVESLVSELAGTGVKMASLTWNGPNPLASGHDTEAPLSPLGIEAVARLEANHVAVDVSHLNDPGFEDVRRISRRPFVASHSNSRAICDVPRNLTDDQFRAIRDAGGIVGLNYCNWFLTHEREDPTADDVLAHVEHWLDLGGEGVVALGSDYDGCTTPSWLAPCNHVTNLRTAAIERFGAEQTERLFFGNAHEFFLRNEQE